MDERDAKALGLEVHHRDMAFVRGYVTCTSCGCNYDASIPAARVPTFCQMYSVDIDPAATEANILRAEACEQWVHERLDRSKVVHPSHNYRYDKWED
ncbi:MAG: hypothetical protein AB3X44_16125 [Leptothrix sp. (in: b-proteobacteria)]